MSYGTRIAIGALSLSAAAFTAIVASEGWSDHAIQPVPGDVWTVGFGTTEGVTPTTTITPPKAVGRALADVQKFEGAVKKCVTAALYQHEYDAFIDLSYNVGDGAFCRSSIPKKLNAGLYPAACETILTFSRLQGRNCAMPENRKRRDGCKGLMDRRERQYRMCTGGV